MRHTVPCGRRWLTPAPVSEVSRMPACHRVVLRLGRLSACRRRPRPTVTAMPPFVVYVGAHHTGAAVGRQRGWRSCPWTAEEQFVVAERGVLGVTSGRAIGHCLAREEGHRALSGALSLLTRRSLKSAGLGRRQRGGLRAEDGGARCLWSALPGRAVGSRLGRGVRSPVGRHDGDRHGGADRDGGDARRRGTADSALLVARRGRLGECRPVRVSRESLCCPTVAGSPVSRDPTGARPPGAHNSCAAS